MNRIARFVLASGAAAVLAAPAGAQITTAPRLTLAGAQQVLDAALTEARTRGAGGAVAVVDDGGNLMALARIDGTFPAAAGVSIGKARTAAMFRKPTAFFEDIVNKGRTTMVALDDFTPLQGGVPILVDGVVVGAVGVSGAMSAAQDTEIAEAAAGALGSDMSRALEDVMFLPGVDVAAAFAKGMPLIEVGPYKIHASRRTEPGKAEVHTRETDIIYVLEGTATLVTGGEVVGGETVAPGEIRGASIAQGKPQTLGPGDVMVVPDGTPHWFSRVQGPFLYYVVKVVKGGGSHEG